MNSSPSVIASKNETPVVDIKHTSNDLIVLFEQTFLDSHCTRLVGGGEEPEYIPAIDLDSKHKIIFTHNYFASALHEIAHWCIAGEQRRQLPDYGYWYAPDGRTVNQQKNFEQVEAKPQALEWLFSRACGSPFKLSADNLEGEVGISDSFKQSVLGEVKYYCTKKNGINKSHIHREIRAISFVEALVDYYQVSTNFSPDNFSLCDLNE
ncbi:MAG: elongation factor P hydroxylase [Candidatus Endobugula sp.]